MNSEPEVLWVDTDRLLHMPHLPPQQADGVSSELEAKLVVRIIHRLIEVGHIQKYNFIANFM